MDGFDDLLAPSRAALEQNPFADPFGHRADSPDPWSSYSHPSTSHLADESSAFADVRSTTPTLTTPTLDSTAFGGDAHDIHTRGFTSFEEERPTDPLELSTTHEPPQEEELQPHAPTAPTSPRSPGFRESVPEPVSIEETMSFTESDRNAASPPPVVSPPLSSAPSSVISPPMSPIESTPLASSAFGDMSLAPSTSTSSSNSNSTYSPFAPAPQRPLPDRTFVSPLDQPHSAMERSFAGLALGGETINGWQGSQSMFVGPVKQQQQQADDDDDDDDDDKPILQARMSLSERNQAGTAPSSPGPVKLAAGSGTGIAPVFMITVDDPQRVGDPIRGYTMYTVHIKTSSPLYSKSAFSALRRYSDFLWLYETLSNNNPGVVVPPVPEKSPFNRFDATFVQHRRMALEKCIQKIANHPVLQKDLDLKLFLESDTFALDIKHRKAEIAHEKGGLMATLGQTITGPRFHETDEWFDKQKAYIDSLEMQLRGLVKSIDIVSKQRFELATSAGDFAAAVTELASSEIGLGAPLANALSGLATVERKVQEVQDKQANEDTMGIMSTADEYARLISSVRLAFSSRVRMYHLWQNADSNVRKVKQAHESNRASGKLPPDMLSRSLAVVADAERKAIEAKQEFDQTSRLVKAEVARFEQERISDFKNSLEVYLNGMITKQKELITAWETYQQGLLKKVTPTGAQQPSAEAEAESSTAERSTDQMQTEA